MSQTKYLLRHQNLLALRKVGQHFVLIDGHANRILVLNTIGRSIFLGLQGRQTLQEITTAIADSYGRPISTVESDVMAFIAELQLLGLVYT